MKRTISVKGHVRKAPVKKQYGPFDSEIIRGLQKQQQDLRGKNQGLQQYIDNQNRPFGSPPFAKRNSRRA